MALVFSTASYRFLLRAGLLPDGDSPSPALRFSPATTLTARRPPIAPLEPPPEMLRVAGQAIVGRWPDETGDP